MRKLLLTLCTIASFALGTQAQEQDNDSTTIVNVCELKANAKQVYQYAKAYLSAHDEFFRFNLQIDNAEEHRLQCAYTHETRMWDKRNYDYYVTEGVKLTVDGRDGKMRIKAETPMFVYSTPRIRHIKMDYATFLTDFVRDRATFDKSRTDYYAKLIEGMKAYIEKQCEEENF